MLNPGEIWLMNHEHAARYFAKEAGTRENSGQSEARGVLAEIHLSGPLGKGAMIEMYGGTSSVNARHAITEAAHDPEVEGIFLVVDSPGGAVAGTEELAGAIAAAARLKPVHAHIDDLGASAAIWAISGATRITANATAAVGSIGCMCMVPDLSGAYEQAGIRWHVVKSAEGKGGPIPEAGIDESDLEPLQERIDDLAAQFQATLADHRGMSADQLKAVSDGRTYSAEKARDLGLIDSVEGAQSAATGLFQAVGEIRARRRAVRRR